MKITRKITKFGNSLGITLPSEALRIAGLKEGDKVYLDVQSQNITIVLKKKEPKSSLS